MYFFIKTNNPRPTFHLDMTPKERTLMEKHVAYWSEKAKTGIAIIFGPVLYPKGGYGIGIYKVKDEKEMKNMIKQDPAKEILDYKIFPMAKAIVGKPQKKINKV